MSSDRSANSEELIACGKLPWLISSCWNAHLPIASGLLANVVVKSKMTTEPVGTLTYSAQEQNDGGREWKHSLDMTMESL